MLGHMIPTKLPASDQSTSVCLDAGNHVPISPHFSGKLITSSFGFNKNNGFILLLTHDLFH